MHLLIPISNTHAQHIRTSWQGQGGLKLLLNIYLNIYICLVLLVLLLKYKVIKVKVVKSSVGVEGGQGIGNMKWPRYNCWSPHVRPPLF